MTPPTQDEFAKRAQSCIDTYNRFYEKYPSHRLSFYSCDAGLRQLELTHTICPDELNVYNTLHGGAMAWMVDSCAGLLCRSYMNITACVTTNLNLSYIRSISPDTPIVIRSNLSNEGRRMLHLTMDIHHMDTEQLYCTASATFYVCE
ncbi:MAG: PaaI family thioesterase [Clostridia bacterium]|nr:PaaI family thioesterase [Clostridia bacterium]